ncbi:MAG: transcription antitermination factor NusB [Desulfobacterales bacterium]|jgi:N utilization substance protein B|nr:transcription antitermination factor NusB [Desulfobacterales bacterium]
MGNRRKSRVLAMQALFYMDMNSNGSKEMQLECFCANFSLSKKARPFFLKLVNGVLQTKSELDSIIENFSDHWKIGRMACVDRNIIRIAVYELMYCRDIPSKVSINEAVDIGKRFGTEESGAFINGILDSIRLALEKNNIKVSLDIKDE